MTHDEFAHLFGNKDYCELLNSSEMLFTDYETRWLITQGEDGRWGAWIDRLEGDQSQMHEGTFSEDLGDELAQFRVQWFPTWEQACGYLDELWEKDS